MTARDRNLLAVVVIAVLIGGLWFGLVSPRRGEVADLRNQVEVARVASAQAEQQAALGLAAKRTYARNQRAMAQLGKAVPSADDRASLLYQLQDAAGRSRVALTAVTPGATDAAAATALPATGVQALPLSLAFEGSYHDLERFLRRIHEFTTLGHKAIAVRGRLVAVQSVTLTDTDVDAGQSPITATIEALTYVASPPPPAAAPAAGAAPPPSAAVDAGTAPVAAATTPAVIGAGG